MRNQALGAGKGAGSFHNQQEPAPSTLQSGAGQFPQSFGRHGPNTAPFRQSFPVQTAPGPHCQGIIRHYALVAKVPGKPIYRGVPGGERGSSRTLFRVLDVSVISGSGPYSWPPECDKEPDPGNHENNVLFMHFLSSYFSAPLPLAPLFVKTAENMVRKGTSLFRLLRLNLGTSKNRVGVTILGWKLACSVAHSVFSP